MSKQTIFNSKQYKQRKRKGRKNLARPKKPEELKRKHRREYMRIYRQKRKELSFDEALKRCTVTPYPSAERTVTTSNMMETAKGE